MTNDVVDNVAEVAGEIQRYLENHPRAADSLDGILLWWLGHQRLQESRHAVQCALDHLVRCGQVCVQQLADGTVVFSRRTN